MRGQIWQPERDRVAQEQAEDPIAMWQVPDRRPLFVVNPGRDKFNERLARRSTTPAEVLLAHDTKRSVLAVDQLHCRLNDAPQNRRQFEVAANGHYCSEQVRKSFFSHPWGDIHTCKRAIFGRFRRIWAAGGRFWGDNRHVSRHHEALRPVTAGGMS